MYYKLNKKDFNWVYKKLSFISVNHFNIYGYCFINNEYTFIAEINIKHVHKDVVLIEENEFYDLLPNSDIKKIAYIRKQRINKLLEL